MDVLHEIFLDPDTVVKLHIGRYEKSGSRQARVVLHGAHVAAFR